MYLKISFAASRYTVNNDKPLEIRTLVAFISVSAEVGLHEDEVSLMIRKRNRRLMQSTINDIPRGSEVARTTNPSKFESNSYRSVLC